MENTGIIVAGIMSLGVVIAALIGVLPLKSKFNYFKLDVGKSFKDFHNEMEKQFKLFYKELKDIKSQVVEYEDEKSTVKFLKDVRKYYISEFPRKLQSAITLKSNNFIEFVKNSLRYDFNNLDNLKDLISESIANYDKCKAELEDHLGKHFVKIMYDGVGYNDMGLYEDSIKEYLKRVEKVFVQSGNGKKPQFVEISKEFMLEFIAKMKKTYFILYPEK